MSIDKPNPIAIESIHGVWFLSESNRPDGSWLLKRESDRPCPGHFPGWGQRFEFHVNGEFVDAYSEECGNDLGIHYWLGIWKWNDERGLLFAQIKAEVKESYMVTPPRIKPSEDYLHGREFQVVEGSDEKLVLMPMTKETRE